MKLFITGGSGFLGQYVVAAALNAGHECVCLYRSGMPEALTRHRQVRWVKGGLRSDWFDELTSVDAVIHLAAVGVSPQKATREESFQVNVIDSLLFIENAVKAGVRRVIACGSCFEYGAAGERYEFIPVDAPLEPLNAYGASKAAATVALSALARELNFALSVLRPFHFYGEGQASVNLWPALRKAALAGEDFEMTPGEQVRDYMPVEEVAAQFVLDLEEAEPTQPLIKNIGSGCPVSLRVFCEKWWSLWEANGELKIGALAYRETEVMRFVPEI